MIVVVAPRSEAATQDDAGSGGDAGAAFATATPVSGVGRFHAQLDPAAGDRDDWYRFFVPQGDDISVEVLADLYTGSIQTSDADRRLGVWLYDPLGLPLDNPVTSVGDTRVAFPKAPMSGEYRLHVNASLRVASYSFCFVNAPGDCVILGDHPIQLGIPLASTHANVLLVPPLHGNPAGPETALDYLDATLRGIRAWEPAIDAFVAKYPAYAHLDRLTVHVEVFDGALPKRAGYDVVVVWSEYTGPIFRGLAVTPLGPGPLHTAMCGAAFTCPQYKVLEPFVHDSTRLIIMSVFASAPRAGQATPDWPEEADVQNVAQHEFAHTWGLGHTATWRSATGPDLMNSPYGLVFGDGDPAGDGGERSPTACVSSLDLYGLARLYEWVGRGVEWRQRQVPQWTGLPSAVPYELYC